MSNSFGFDDLSDPFKVVDEDRLLALREGLRKFVRSPGQLQSSSSIEQELARLSSKDRVRIDELADAALQDPVLAIRLIAMANGSLYAAPQKALSVSAALNRFGLMRLLETARQGAEFVELSRSMQGRALTLIALQELMLASTIARQFAKVGGSEITQIAICASKIMMAFSLGLAWYKPNLYSSCILRLHGPGEIGFEEAFESLLNCKLSDFAAGALEEWSYPSEFAAIMRAASDPRARSQHTRRGAAELDFVRLGQIAAAARDLAAALSAGRGRDTLRRLYEEVDRKELAGINQIEDLLIDAMEEFAGLCRLMKIQPLIFGEQLYVRKARLNEVKSVEESSGQDNADELPGIIKRGEISQRLALFLQELRICFKTRYKPGEYFRLPQVVLCTLFALLKGLDFRRAAFLRFDNRDKRFLPAILLGLECEDFFEMDRSMQGRDLDYMPEAQAYMKGQPVFAGDPIFEGGFPFAAFPVIWKGKFHGVFYADMSGSKKRAAMNLQTQMGCLALAELWRSVPAEFN